MRISARQSKVLSTAFLPTPQPGVVVKTNAVKQLTFAGKTTDHEGVPGMVKFKGIAQVKPVGGHPYTATDTSFTINECE